MPIKLERQSNRTTNAVDTTIDTGRELEVNYKAGSHIETAFSGAGLKSHEVYKVLKDGLVARKAITNKFGDVTYEDDYNVRHKYMVTAMELMGHLRSKVEEVKGVSVNINLREGDVDRIEGIAMELDKLSKRIMLEGWQRGEVVDVEVVGGVK